MTKPKTLADMSLEEREACKGMWASFQEHHNGRDISLRGIISDIEDEEGHAWISFPRDNADAWPYPFENVVLHYDLPRAWDEDGEPEDGASEESSAELPTKDFKGTYTQHYRRWVSDWEPVEGQS